jgi:hypothetical protein
MSIVCSAKEQTGNEGGSVFHVVEAAKQWVEQNAASMKAEQLLQGIHPLLIHSKARLCHLTLFD